MTDVQPLEIAQLIAAATDELGLPASFLSDLLNEDDWSFVVKAHALLESIVTEALLEHVKEQQLHEHLTKLQLARKRPLLEAFEPDLFDTNDRRFMNAMSELRNRLAHSARRVGFTFDEELTDDVAVRKFEADFTAPFPGGSLNAGVFAKGLGLTRQYPKVIVWTSLTLVTAKVQGYKQRRRANAGVFQRALLNALRGAEPTEPGG